MEKRDKTKQVISNLEAAIDILKRGGADRIESVSWRVADAGLTLREIAEENGVQNVQGVHFPTGRGAILPEKQR